MYHTDTPSENIPLEQKTLDFIHELQTLYLEQRELEKLLSCMAPGICWIGTGKGEICTGIDEAKAALTKEFEEYPGSFSILYSDYQARAAAKDVCIVYGKYCARPVSDEVAEVENRVTAVCVETNEGIRLSHIHFSVADVDQEPGRYYARREAVMDRALLQQKARQTARALEAREQELLTLTKNVPGGIHQCINDDEFTLISVTEGFLKLVGYTRKELQQQFQDCFARLILEEDRSCVLQTIREQLSRGDMIELEYRVRCKNGQILWILDKGKLTVLPDGTETFYCILLDNTFQRKAQEELRLSLERHQIIMDQAADIIFEWDIKKDTLLFSPNWRKKFGYEAISEDISRRIPFSENIHPEDMNAFVKIMKDTGSGVPYSETEFRIRDTLGNYVWCRIRATTQYDSCKRPVKAVGVIVDVDADKKQRQRLLDEAQRDSLTGLFNKSAARQAVEAALAEETTDRGVLMIIDLDDFKGINDRYGHLLGDTVLSDMASILKRLFRTTDVVARIGGDEFLVCLPGAPPEAAEYKGREIIAAVGKITVNGRTGQISCSVGAAVYPGDAKEFLELYRCADLALYQVKNMGKGGFAFYTPNLCTLEPDDSVIHSAVSSVIDSDAELVNEKLGQYCFRMLYRAIEPAAAVNQILEIVGRTYDVSRVRIFESSRDGLSYSNTFRWCNVGLDPEQDRMPKLSYREDMGKYLEKFHKDGVFYCKNLQNLNSGFYALLYAQGVRSLLQCAIVDDGEFKGFVSFENNRENRHFTKAQIGTLTLVANVLSTFLIKLRLKEELQRIVRAPKEEDGGTGTYME